jgi:hypothetical protein
MLTGLALAAEKEEVKIPITSIKVLDALKKLDPIEAGTEDSFDWAGLEIKYKYPETWDYEKYTYKWDNAVFTSSDNSVLVVGKYGSYKARKAGKVTVTVASEWDPSIKDTFDVEVKAKPVVTKLSFSSSSVEVAVGESLSLGQFATIEPSGVPLTYTLSSKSSDPEIVEANGWNVEGVKAGSATVTFTITNEDGSSVSATATVTVTEKALKSLSFSKSSITINKAEKSSISLYEYLTISPINANNVKLKWESSNEQVASLSGSTVYANRPGTATITVKSVTNPEIQASIEIVVVESEAITEVKFDEKSIVLYYVEKAGKLYDQYNSQYVPLNIQPDAARSTIKTVNWRTSNANVAIPDGDSYGVSVKAVGKGTCTISVYFKDTAGKEYSGSFKVKVTDKSPTAKLNKKSITLKVKKSFKLTAKDADKKTALKGKWTTSDKKVAKVNSKGKVTAVNPGRAVITFTPKNKGMKKVTCVVTVTK